MSDLGDLRQECLDSGHAFYKKMKEYSDLLEAEGLTIPEKIRVLGDLNTELQEQILT